MGNIALETNNPGNLTVTGPNAFLYPGQSGVYASPNGFYYATFPDAASGFAALVNYVQAHIAEGWNTLGGFLSGYLNGTPNAPLTNTSANPATANYLSVVENVTGLSAGSSLVGVNPSQIAAGIATAEGASSLIPPGLATGPQGGAGAPDTQSVGQGVGAAVGGLFNPSGGQAGGSSSWVGDIADIADMPAAIATGIVGGNTSSPTNGPQTNVGGAVGAGIGAATGANQVSGAISGVESWLGGAAGNVVWVLVGLVLLIGAIYMLAVQSGAAPPPRDVAAAVAA